MTELLTAAQMRAIEEAAIEAGEVTGLELMERAGQGVVDAIMEWRPELAVPREDGRPHRAAILCGPGNNGGDGFVVARLLKERGWESDLFLFGDLGRLPSDAAENARRWQELGTIMPLTNDPDVWEVEDPDYALCIDALFGTGRVRAMKNMGLVEDELNFWAWAFGNGDPLPAVVAVDVPSGLCADSGTMPGWGDLNPLTCCITANLTVTFHAMKPGHVLSIGPDVCGELRVIDLGLGHDGKEGASTIKLVSGRAPWRMKKKGGWHKFHFGHALVLSGGVGRGGAARLAARGALRVGAGLVTVGCPPSALTENASRLDAVMVQAVNGARGLLGFEGLEKVAAVCVGPGFGVGERCRAMVAAVLCGGEGGPHSSDDGGVEPHPTGWGVVLDADALTSFEGEPSALFAMLHERCVLTPHMGEFWRLFPDIAAKLEAPAERGPAYSKVDAAREAAARAGCTVLLKGADTVIASADGRAAINSAACERAAPWLATAGSGDVLAGFIAGLLARGFEPQAAAEMGAWLHVECALKFGPGLIAEDLPEQLPAVFRDLGL
ncbi:MAG: NAD(P)H-hydrate dehydratase [Pseudomonadota bacterium]